MKEPRMKEPSQRRLDDLLEFIGGKARIRAPLPVSLRTFYSFVYDRTWFYYSRCMCTSYDLRVYYFSGSTFLRGWKKEERMVTYKVPSTVWGVRTAEGGDKQAAHHLCRELRYSRRDAGDLEEKPIGEVLEHLIPIQGESIFLRKGTGTFGAVLAHHPSGAKVGFRTHYSHHLPHPKPHLGLLLCHPCSHLQLPLLPGWPAGRPVVARRCGVLPQWVLTKTNKREVMEWSCMHSLLVLTQDGNHVPLHTWLLGGAL